MHVCQGLACARWRKYVYRYKLYQHQQVRWKMFVCRRIWLSIFRYMYVYSSMLWNVTCGIAMYVCIYWSMSTHIIILMQWIQILATRKKSSVESSVRQFAWWLLRWRLHKKTITYAGWRTLCTLSFWFSNHSFMIKIDLSRIEFVCGDGRVKL